MMNLKPIHTKRIYMEIVDQIKELFISGNLQPGDKLLSERDLAERLQVSRASVREALSALEAMGLLEIRPGEGTFVRQTRMDKVIGPLSLLFLMEQDKGRELLEVRKIMETEAAGLAALRSQPEDIDVLIKILHRMEKELEQGDWWEESDLDFHVTVAKMADNSILLRLMNTISDVMGQMLKRSGAQFFGEPKDARILIEQHYEIMKAIKAKDADAARAAMLNHLIFGGKKW